MTSMGCPYLSSTRATARDSISAVTCMHVGRNGALLMAALAAVTDTTDAAATEATEAAASDVEAAPEATEAVAMELVADVRERGKELAMEAIDRGVVVRVSAAADKAMAVV